MLPLILRWLKPSDDCPHGIANSHNPTGVLTLCRAVPRPGHSRSAPGEKLTLLDILTDAEVVQFVRTVGGGGGFHSYGDSRGQR